jgi:hypothetical protein
MEFFAPESGLKATPPMILSFCFIFKSHGARRTFMEGFLRKSASYTNGPKG